MRQTRKLYVISMILACSLGSVQAAPIVTQTWDGGPNPVWVENEINGVTTLAVTGGGNPANYLQITGGSTGPLADETQVSTVGAPFAGNVNYQSLGVRSIRFDFYNAGSTPGSLELYFVSGGSFTWSIQIDIGGGWGSYAINLSADDAPGGWYSTSHTAAQFWTDLQDVDEIGFYLIYNLNGAQTYGIDDFQLNDQYLIPEPSTYAMLAFSFLSLGITFRRKLRDGIATLRQHLAA